MPAVAVMLGGFNEALRVLQKTIGYHIYFEIKRCLVGQQRHGRLCPLSCNAKWSRESYRCCLFPKRALDLEEGAH